MASTRRPNKMGKSDGFGDTVAVNTTEGAGASMPPTKTSRVRQNMTKFDKRVLASMKKQAEPNYFDSGFSASGIDFSGALSDVCAVPQGTTDSNRTGDMITPLSLEIRANVVLGDTTNLLRVLLFRWNEPSSPTPGSVLNPTSVATAAAPLAPLNADNYRQGRFEVLHDTCIGLDSAHVNVVFQRMIKFPAGRAICFNGGSTTGAGKIYLLLISDSGAVPNPQVAMTSRLTFVTDL